MERLRFKDENGNQFPEWNIFRLSELGEGYSGLSGLNKEYFNTVNDNALYITYMDVFSRNFITKPSGTFLNNNENHNIVKNGDILFTTSSEIIEEVGMSSVYVGNEVAYLNSFCFGWTSSTERNNYFMGYLLNNHKFRKKVIKLGQGSTRFNISKNKLLDLKLKIPTLKEQEKIGNFLSLFDRLLEKINEKIELLKELKKGYLQQMFPTKCEKAPMIRFSGFVGDWENFQLKQVTNYENGKGHEHIQSNYGAYELINLNSISIEGGLKPSGRFVEKSDAKLYKDDIVMVLSDVAHGNLLGRVAVIPENDKYVLNQRIALLRPNGILESKYLFYAINNNQHYFKLHGAGSSQLNISKESVENFKLLAPKKLEQIKLIEFFDGFLRIINLNKIEMNSVSLLRTAYMQRLFA